MNTLTLTPTPTPTIQPLKKIELSDHEKSTIIEQMQALLEANYVPCSTHAIEEIYEHWARNNYNLWERMGKQLIVEIQPSDSTLTDSAYATQARVRQAIITTTNHYPEGWVGSTLPSPRSRSFNFSLESIKPFLENKPISSYKKEYFSGAVHRWMKRFLLALGDDYENWKDNPELSQLGLLFFDSRMELMCLEDVLTRPTRVLSSLIHGLEMGEVDSMVEFFYELVDACKRVFTPTPSPKFTKCLSRAPKFGPATQAFYEETILFISQLNNQIKMAKEDIRIRLSIHPMDFLTMSENDSGWRSCVALDGEYAGSTTAWMLDESTMVGYVESGRSQIEFNGLHWNNKRWRALFHTSTDQGALVSNKHYPQVDPAVEAAILDWWGETDLFGHPYTSPELAYGPHFGSSIHLNYDSDYVYFDSLRRIVHPKRDTEFAFELGAVSICPNCAYEIDEDDNNRRDGVGIACWDCDPTDNDEW